MLLTSVPVAFTGVFSVFIVFFIINLIENNEKNRKETTNGINGRDIFVIVVIAMAIQDGVLVDVSEIAREAGFKLPTVMTRASWEDCVSCSTYQDEYGRLWDILNMARLKLLRNKGKSEVEFSLYRIAKGGNYPSLVKLKIICGPGDNAEPVLTILFPEED